jgi:hypothetical protein
MYRTIGLTAKALRIVAEAATVLFVGFAKHVSLRTLRLKQFSEFLMIF